MWNCRFQLWGLQRRIRRNNGRYIDVAVGHLLYGMIMMTRGTINIAIDLDVGRAVLARIQCNRAEQLVPGGVVCNCGLARESVQVI